MISAELPFTLVVLPRDSSGRSELVELTRQLDIPRLVAGFVADALGIPGWSIGSQGVSFIAPKLLRLATELARSALRHEVINSGRVYADLIDVYGEGRVHGPVDHSWHFEVAEQEPCDTALVIIFWARAGAPLVGGRVPSSGNHILEMARGRIAEACMNYVTYRDKFKEEEPWVNPLPLEGISPDDLPMWFAR
jgi:hypothetical protein